MIQHRLFVILHKLQSLETNQRRGTTLRTGHQRRNTCLALLIPTLGRFFDNEDFPITIRTIAHPKAFAFILQTRARLSLHRLHQNRTNATLLEHIQATIVQRPKNSILGTTDPQQGEVLRIQPFLSDFVHHLGDPTFVGEGAEARVLGEADVADVYFDGCGEGSCAG